MALDKLKESASLSEAVEFTNNIKNEISTIKTALANNITNKGVTASNSESLTSLIDKVKNIEAQQKVKAGTNKSIGTIPSKITTNTAYVEAGSLDILVTGTISIKTGIKGTLSSGGYVKVELVRNSATVDSFENSIRDGNSYKYFNKNLDVKFGDKIVAYVKSSDYSYSATASATQVTCNI